MLSALLIGMATASPCGELLNHQPSITGCCSPLAPPHSQIDAPMREALVWEAESSGPGSDGDEEL